MSAYPLPWFGKTAEMPALGLSEEGLGWVTDLTISDPTMIVPVLIGAGNLINVEVRIERDNKTMVTYKSQVECILRKRTNDDKTKGMDQRIPLTVDCVYTHCSAGTDGDWSVLDDIGVVQCCSKHGI